MPAGIKNDHPSASSLRRQVRRPFRREGQRAPGFAKYFSGSWSQSLNYEIWSSNDLSVVASMRLSPQQSLPSSFEEKRDASDQIKMNQTNPDRESPRFFSRKGLLMRAASAECAVRHPAASTHFDESHLG